MVVHRIGNFLRLRRASCNTESDKVLLGEFAIDQDLVIKKGKSVTPEPYQTETYEAFWAKLTTEVIPSWKDTGEIPRASLRPLLELIETYFAEKGTPESQRKFAKNLLEWASSLKESSLDDVNFLYGQRIKYGNKSAYLIEILMDCLEGTNSELDSEIKGIASWLCEYDASFIAKSPDLKELYDERKIGPAFTCSDLYDALDGLSLTEPDPKSRVKDRISKLQSLLHTKIKKGKTKISFDDMNALGEIYRLRSVRMLEEEESVEGPTYFSDPEGVLKNWRRLAETVCGAGLLELLRERVKPQGPNVQHYRDNYYRFMMPTLQHDTDPIQLDCLTDHDLGHCVLSNDNKSMINLNNCLSRYTKLPVGAKTWHNCNPRYTRAFTEKEVSRMYDASEKFHVYIPLADHDCKMADEPISVNTIMVLRQLIVDSFIPRTLAYGEVYSEEEMRKAGAAYHLFYNFLKEMDPEERKTLAGQRIILGGENFTFDQVIYEIDKNGADGCISGCNRLFLALILNYASHLRFSPELENIIGIYKMRQNGQKKVFSEYADIDEKEAKRRLQILTVSIMSHKFQYPLIGNTVTFWGSSNTMVGVSGEIFQLISPLIDSGEGTDARHVYANIMELVVKPALKDKSWLRYTDTINWLESINDETIFKQQRLWFDPVLLLSALSPLEVNDPDLYQYVERFLDELVHTYAQSQTTSQKELRVNIHFENMLGRLDEKKRTQLLELLSASHLPVSNDKRPRVPFYINHLIHRLAVIGATYWVPGFFTSTSSFNKDKADKITAFLSKGVFSSAPEEVFSNIILKIHGLKNVCTQAEINLMSRHLGAMMGQPDVALNPERVAGRTPSVGLGSGIFATPGSRSAATYSTESSSRCHLGSA